MTERTDLVLVRLASPVCTDCTALASPFDPHGLCDRCAAYRGLVAATLRWTPAQRTALADVIAVLVRTTPPEDAHELLGLVEALVVAAH